MSDETFIAVRATSLAALLRVLDVVLDDSGEDMVEDCDITRDTLDTACETFDEAAARLDEILPGWND